MIMSKCPKCGKESYSPTNIIVDLGVSPSEKYGPIIMKCSECGYYDKEEAYERAEEMAMSGELTEWKKERK